MKQSVALSSTSCAPAFSANYNEGQKWGQVASSANPCCRLSALLHTGARSDSLRAAFPFPSFFFFSPFLAVFSISPTVNLCFLFAVSHVPVQSISTCLDWGVCNISKKDVAGGKFKTMGPNPELNQSCCFSGSSPCAACTGALKLKGGRSKGCFVSCLYCEFLM